MKKLHFIVCVLGVAMSLFMQSCDQQDALPVTKSNVTFTFSADDNGRTSSSITDATTLVLSLESTSGAEVMSQQKVKLLSFGGDYVTEPIELAPGSYVITDFMLTNDSSEVLFATPKAGSSLAPIVKHPLQYNFSVTKNKSVSIAMEVVPVDAHTSADFGYASFGVHVVRPLSLAVFVPTAAGFKLSGAKAYLIKEGDTLANYTLGAKVNILPFKLDPDVSYRMDIIQDAYTRSSQAIVYNDLIDSLNGDALKVYLAPAITFRLKSWAGEFDYDPFEIALGASGTANVIVDWGDGTSEPATIRNLYGSGISHQYPNADANYFITMTGDIGKIQLWDTYPNNMGWSAINFNYAFDLRDVNFYFDSPNILDLRKNETIESVVFSGTELLLPTQHNLREIALTGLEIRPQLNEIIHNVYANAVAKGFKTGAISYELHQDSGGEAADWSSLSPQVYAELQHLYYAYGWSISPAVQ